MGVGEALTDKKVLENAVSDMEAISGQKAVVTKARKSVAGFKVREGWPIGCKVTLRSERMYDFLDRLISISIPRIRDFRGLNPKSFDGQGNYSMGIKEQIIFPEIEFDKIDKNTWYGYYYHDYCIYSRRVHVLYWLHSSFLLENKPSPGGISYG